jgi:hypothetical protein
MTRLTCFGHLGRRDINRNDPECRTAQGGQGKKGHGVKLPTVSLINLANVNDPIVL